MRLSRVVLKRGDQEAVLQGMIHIAPDKLYGAIQGDVDLAVKNGYKIFFEGVKKEPLEKALSNNEDKIREFFLLLFDLLPFFAAALGVSLQKDKIRYPKDAINADITFAELTKQLDRNGFRCGLFLWLFTSFPEEELKKVMEKEFAKMGGLNAIMDSSDRWSFINLITWFFFRKAMPIILDYRNEVALAKVRAHLNGRSIFLHYGEKHINGLMGLFKRDGWAVKEVSYIDLAKFC